MTETTTPKAAPTETIGYILLWRAAGRDVVYELDDAARLTDEEISWLSERGMYDRKIALYGTSEAGR